MAVSLPSYNSYESGPFPWAMACNGFLTCTRLVGILTKERQYEYPQNGKDLQFISREASYRTLILWKLSFSNSTSYCNSFGLLVQATQLCQFWERPNLWPISPMANYTTCWSPHSYNTFSHWMGGPLLPYKFCYKAAVSVHV